MDDDYYYAQLGFAPPRTVTTCNLELLHRMYTLGVTLTETFGWDTHGGPLCCLILPT
jgi:hypothetical protein